MTQSAKQAGTPDSQSIVKGLWGVRYQVKDVSRSINSTLSSSD